MPYKVSLDPAAQRQWRNLPRIVQSRVESAIRKLVDDPRPAGCRKLSGCDDWRLRVGDYRIIYGIDDAERVVVVGWIGPRKDAYKGN